MILCREWADLLGLLVTDPSAYLSVALLLSPVHVPHLLHVPQGGLRFDHNVFRAFCVRRVRWLGQIHKILSFLATEPDPVQALPHGGYRDAALYSIMRRTFWLETLEERLVSVSCSTCCSFKKPVSVRARMRIVHRKDSLINYCGFLSYYFLK